MTSSKLDARAVAEYLTSIRDRFDDEKRKQMDRVIDTLQDGAGLARVIPDIRRLLVDRGELIERLNALLPPSMEFSDEGRTKLQEALEFITQVKARYENKPEVYQSFLRVLGDYQRELVDTATVVGQVRQLLSGEAGLLEAFERFVPRLDKRRNLDWAVADDLTGMQRRQLRQS